MSQSIYLGTAPELNTLWERLAFQQQSHTIPTVINRQINKAVIEFSNWYDENKWLARGPELQKYYDLYLLTNAVLEKAIETIPQNNTNTAGNRGFEIGGRVPHPIPAAKVAKKDHTTLYIFAAAIAIIGTIGILQSRKGKRALASA